MSSAELLVSAGFEFDEEKAEWLRWFNALVAHEASAHASCSGEEGAPRPLAASYLAQERTKTSLPSPLTDLDDLYLMNWAGVQRIARRSRRLSQERIELLDTIRFDWEGADPLS